MKTIVFEAISWLAVFVIMSFLCRFGVIFFQKKYETQKTYIEELKKTNLPYLMAEGVNEHVLKTYINGLKLGKWFCLLLGIVVVIRIFVGHFYNLE